MLTFEHLETLRAIAKARTFSRAAEELFLTQPAISQRVKQMEQAMGVRLFRRDSRRREVALTPAGERVLCFANSVLDSLKSLQDELHAERTTERRTVTITTGGPFITKYVLPHLLTHCRDQLPGIHVKVTQTGVDQLNDALRTGEADFAVQAGSHVDADLATVPLYRDRLLLVAAPDHPVLKEGIKYLTKGPAAFVLPPSRTEAREIAERWAASLGITMDVVMESISFDALKEAVHVGLGLCVLSEIVARPELNRGELRVVPMPGLPAERQLCLTWDPARPMTHLAESVLEIVASGAWRTGLRETVAS
jgi:DNA-binding transcriptional LysR family regulator